ncbi:UNVERIFIED_CONTAM: Sugar transport protein 8 [Sesamum calycinum]|uniref:Sugar transport protein 8 n=1 Tax=Sesamum calycinum TaxID=2727403 RepID=A0AAW2R926_9LAMI
MSTVDKNNYNSRVTPYVFACWILAAFGGLMFGYDIGISGGVTGMDEFLMKFFPKVHERKMHAAENNYCKYDDEMLQLFTSSLYIAALVASFFASKACSLLGRRPTILMASTFFIAGAIFCGAANAKWMLIFGRILFGIGVGFGNEAVPLFLSEIAPINHRGAVNILFQLLVTIGILVANLINYGTSMMKKNGWRLSLGLAAVPGVILLIGSLIITETPPSLIERGKEMEGRAALQKIRGVDNVDAEFQQIVTGCEQAKKVFQQFTGINAIMFYAPVLFQTLGFKSDASLLSAVITGLVNVGATFVSIYAVDKNLIVGVGCNWSNLGNPPEGNRVIGQGLGSCGGDSSLHIRDVICMVVGANGMAHSSEIFPIETRTAGFAFAVSTNMICTFIIAQAFLSMLCHMRAYIFFFFSAWILIMGLFVVFLLPETKGVPIELVEERVWKQHPVWKKFFKDDVKETTD